MSRPVTGYALAVTGTVIAVLVRWLLGRAIGEWAPFVTFYPVVAVSAALAGTRAGLLATALTGLAAGFFFLEPRGELSIERSGDRIALGLFLIVNTGVSLLGGKLRQIYEKLRQSSAESAELAALVENSDDAIFSTDLSGIITTWNSGAERLFGYARAEIIGKSVKVIIPVERHAEEESFLSSLASGKEMKLHETVRQTKGGREIVVEVRRSPLRNASGGIVGSLRIARDTTQRHQAEEALRTSQERLNFATVAAKLGTWDWNMLNGELVWSPACCELFGLSPTGSMTYERFVQAVHPEDRARIEQAVRMALEKHVDYDVEMRTASSDGKLRWIASRGRAHYDSAGRPTRMSGVAFDITERKTMQAELQESQTRFRQIAATLHHVFWISELEPERVLFVSPGFEHIWGRPASELYANPRLWTDAIHPEDQPEVKRVYEEWIQRPDQVRFDVEYRLVRPDGTVRWISDRGTVIYGPDRKIARLTGVAEDITRRKLIENALRESETRSRLAVETAELGTYERDLVSKKIELNHVCRNIMGFPEGELPQDVAYRSVHPDDKERVFAAVARAFDPGLREVCAAEFRILRPDGTVRWVAGRGRVIFDDGKPLKFLGVLNDITVRKHAEEQLLAAKEELSKANADLEQKVSERTAKLVQTVEELETFSYSLVHDMRAPLRAMQGYASVLEFDSGNELAGDGLEYLRRIKIAATRLDELIKDSLNYSSLLRGEIQVGTVNLGRLLEGLVHTYPNLQEPGARVRVEVGDVLVLGNEAALTQVFSNLLGNAVKFVAPGVKPKVRVWGETLPGEASAAARQEGGKALIWVEDNGIGIPREEQHRIFGMFQRAHRAEDYPGTGIGLAIVQKSLERIGGRVCVDSEEGKGSRFCVELRLAQKSADDLREEAA